MTKTKLQCQHTPKTHRLVFGCKITGKYAVDLCKNCRENEPKEFLVEETELS
jgi:hypothetical protein